MTKAKKLDKRTLEYKEAQRRKDPKLRAFDKKMSRLIGRFVKKELERLAAENAVAEEMSK